MHQVTESFIKKIDKDIAKEHNEKNYGQVDIWTLMQCLALDVIGETAFGSSFNMIEDNSHFIPHAITEDMMEGAIASMYPILSKFILKNGGRINPKLSVVNAAVKHNIQQILNASFFFLLVLDRDY
jgi:hypothetical protein